MFRVKKIREETVKITKLVHGGQGLGVLDGGKKAFVWGALPGETVKFQITKSKKDWCQGVAVEVIKPSPERVEPKEPEIYLATSPWQILRYDKEAEHKQAILAETFDREGININWQKFYQDEREFGYRNKMEYNFWFDNDTKKVSLALHKRGSHQKVSVSGSLLASEYINEAGQKLIDFINQNHIEARPLKSVIIRTDGNNKAGISLFVNDKNIINEFKNFNKNINIIFEIIYSNPKSPASVATEILRSTNEVLTDKLLDKDFQYSTRSFFQVNIPVYEQVLSIIAQNIKNQTNHIAEANAVTLAVVDMYSGVGSIGLSVIGENQKLTMIETSPDSTAQAKLNIAGRKNCEILNITAEDALEHITGNEIIILDPPRVGLHKKVTEKLGQTKPKKIIYLSCNPATQARDIKILHEKGYEISYAQGFNFFPRTPHIESLLILSL